MSLKRDIVVIGASVGGVEALRAIAAGLPADFAASVFAVLHTSSNSPGVLAGILERAGPLPAICVNGIEAVRPGRIYVPRPDHHLVVEPGYARATRGPKENRFRPAVDPLFRSAARAFGPRVTGVVLSGALYDGSLGLMAVKTRGGIAIVQDPREAAVASMPRSALNLVAADYVLESSAIAAVLNEVVMAPVGRKGGKPMADREEQLQSVIAEDQPRSS